MLPASSHQLPALTARSPDVASGFQLAATGTGYGLTRFDQAIGLASILYVVIDHDGLHIEWQAVLP
jgi:hypothetical protein